MILGILEYIYNKKSFAFYNTHYIHYLKCPNWIMLSKLLLATKFLCLYICVRVVDFCSAIASVKQQR